MTKTLCSMTRRRRSARRFAPASPPKMVSSASTSPAYSFSKADHHRTCAQFSAEGHPLSQLPHMLCSMDKQPSDTVSELEEIFEAASLLKVLVAEDPSGLASANNGQPSMQ